MHTWLVIFLQTLANVWKNISVLNLNWRSILLLSVLNFYKTPFVAKPTSPKELGKKWIISLKSNIISLASVCSCITSVHINQVTSGQISSFNFSHTTGFNLNFRKWFVSFPNENNSKTDLKFYASWLLDEENFRSENMKYTRFASYFRKLL